MKPWDLTEAEIVIGLARQLRISPGAVLEQPMSVLRMLEILSLAETDLAPELELADLQELL